MSNQGSNVYKARILTKGRLIVDTYMAAKELVRDTDYNLTMMAKKHLKIDRKDIEDVPACYKNVQSIQ